MSQVTVETIKAIGRARTQIELLQFEDNESLIEVGAALEALMGEIPETCTLANESVILCLQALQAVFQGEVKDLEVIRREISATLIGIEQGLAFPPHPAMDKLIIRGQQGLQNELDKISAASEEVVEIEEVSTEAKEPILRDSKELISLDDIASLLLQLELTDKDDLMRLRDAVKRISGQSENPEAVQKLLSQAAREINQVIRTGS
ncbi:MAG: hypothetical protein HC846_05855, partial [Blastocatellia bacterium]|nr:hypothetical protein [Blastocatellia bacterium]